MGQWAECSTCLGGWALAANDHVRIQASSKLDEFPNFHVGSSLRRSCVCFQFPVLRTWVIPSPSPNAGGTGWCSWWCYTIGIESDRFLLDPQFELRALIGYVDIFGCETSFPYSDQRSEWTSWRAGVRVQKILRNCTVTLIGWNPASFWAFVVSPSWSW